MSKEEPRYAYDFLEGLEGHEENGFPGVPQSFVGKSNKGHSALFEIASIYNNKIVVYAMVKKYYSDDDDDGTSYKAKVTFKPSKHNILLEITYMANHAYRKNFPTYSLDLKFLNSLANEKRGEWKIGREILTSLFGVEVIRGKGTTYVLIFEPDG